jgi:hypothetical protein
MFDWFYKWWYAYKQPTFAIKIMPLEKDRPPVSLLPGRRSLTPEQLLEWYFRSEKSKLPPFPAEEV